MAIAAAPPPFAASATPVTAAQMPYSWRPGCPVPPSRLRMLRIAYWGFDGRRHVGALIVRDRAVPQVVVVFRRLYRARFPIRSMRPVDAFGGSDTRSMAADNTSAFNGRFVAGTTRWSMHAYGIAIDVNPVENPYVSGDHVSPAAGRPYADRSLYRRGMLHARDKVVRAFASIGWKWGGYWRPARDYQHFSATGR